jgi:hypothetical protein
MLLAEQVFIQTTDPQPIDHLEILLLLDQERIFLLLKTDLSDLWGIHRQY